MTKRLGCTSISPMKCKYRTLIGAVVDDAPVDAERPCECSCHDLFAVFTAINPLPDFTDPMPSDLLLEYEALYLNNDREKAEHELMEFLKAHDRYRYELMCRMLHGPFKEYVFMAVLAVACDQMKPDYDPSDIMREILGDLFDDDDGDEEKGGNRHGHHHDEDDDEAPKKKDPNRKRPHKHVIHVAIMGGD